MPADELNSLLTRGGIDNKKVADIVAILLWYGVWGQANGRAVTYIYNVNYEMPILKGFIRKLQEEGLARTVPEIFLARLSNRLFAHVDLSLALPARRICTTRVTFFRDRPASLCLYNPAFVPGCRFVRIVAPCSTQLSKDSFNYGALPRRFSKAIYRVRSSLQFVRFSKRPLRQ
jgi:hypothetical protein